MIKKYFDFSFFLLLESILKVNPEFGELIKSISDKDPVAKMLLSLIDKDINTNVNYLKPSDKNDDMKFVNDTQVKRFIDAGQDPFDRATNSAKIGRTVRQILTTNGISVTDPQIEKFVNTYKNTWDKSFKKTGEGIHVVSGEDIRDWYLVDKYVPGGGQLNSSCMRYEETQSFLNIYTENPDVCQLVILVDDKNRLLGRALLWKLIGGVNKYGYYLDRIYTRFDNDAEKIHDWYKDFIKATDDDYMSHFMGKTRESKVQLKKWKFEKYPYMDTLSVLDYEDGVLGTYAIEDRSKLQYHIQNTEGDPNVPNHDWSDHYQRWLSSRESIYVNSLNDYYLESDCVRGYDDNWIFKDNSIYSDYYKSYIDKDNAVNLEGFGLVDSDDIITVYDNVKDGRPSDPKKFLRSKLDNSNYLNVEIGFNDYWVNSKFCLWDAYNGNNIIKTDRLDDEYITLYMIDSDEFNQSDRIFNDLLDSLSVYYHSWGIEDKYTKFPIFLNFYDKTHTSRKKYSTKETLEYFNFKVVDRPVVYIRDEDYYKGYSRMCYKYSVDIIKKYTASIEGCNPEPLLKNLKEIGDYLYSNNVGSYRAINDSYSGKEEYGSYTSYFNSVISKLYKDNGVIEYIKSDESINRIISDLQNNYRGFTFEDLDKKEISVDTGDSDDILKDKVRNFVKTFEDLILYFSYWYIVFNDSDYAHYRFESYMTEKSLEMNTRAQSIISNYVRYSDVGGKFATGISSIRREISNKYDSLTSSVLVENDIDRYHDQHEKSIKVFNNFLTFLK